jgi:Zn-finger nucleic acid-binding protein
MICPNCQTTLLMMDRQGVTIDYCPNCRGVWLDKGELEKIIERSAQYEQQIASPVPPRPTPPPPPQATPYPTHQPYPSHQPSGGSYYQKPYKKKKSFLSDFLDFD